MKEYLDLISLIIEIGFSILSVPVSATLSPTLNECTVSKLTRYVLSEESINSIFLTLYCDAIL